MIRKKHGFVSTASLLFLVIFLYALFAPSRVKLLGAFSINGADISNVVYLYAIVLIAIVCQNRGVIKGFQVRLFSLYVLVVSLNFLVCLAYGPTVQSLYSQIVTFAPFLFVFAFKYLKDSDFEFIIFVLCVATGVYAILTLCLSLMGVVGSQFQARVRMPIGSTITVSYFFDLMSPIVFMQMCRKSGNHFRLYGVLLMIIVVAVVSQASRMATVSMIIELGLCILFVRGVNNKVVKRLVIATLGAIIVLFVATRYFDISRLFVFSNNASLAARNEAAAFGMTIFKDHSILGTGTGGVYPRAWTDREIFYNGVSGLVDPHNMYVMMLSELGVVGSGVFVLICYYFVKGIRKIKEKEIRNAGLILIFGIALCSIGGSQIFNEISFSTVFWFVVALFVNKGYLKGSA